MDLPPQAPQGRIIAVAGIVRGTSSFSAGATAFFVARAAEVGPLSILLCVGTAVVVAALFYRFVAVVVIRRFPRALRFCGTGLSAYPKIWLITTLSVLAGALAAVAVCAWLGVSVGDQLRMILPFAIVVWGLLLSFWFVRSPF